MFLSTHDDWEHYPELRSRITGVFATLVAVPLKFGGVVHAALVLTMRREHRFMASDRAFLAVVAAPGCDLGQIGYETALLAHRVAYALEPEARVDGQW